MNRNIVLATTFLLLSSKIFAQMDTSYWYRSINASFNVNQANFSGNWKGGGVTSEALSATLNIKSDKHFGRNRIVNEVQLAYGQFYNPVSNVSWRKNLDRIFIDNKYSRSIDAAWAAFGSLTFQSQFYKGYKYDTYMSGANVGKDSTTLISNFLAPGYLDEAIGLEYQRIPSFSARLGFLAMRQIFSIDGEVSKNVRTADGKSYGVSEGVKVKNQFGLNIVLKYDKNLAKNINLKVSYLYFSQYSNLKVSTHRADILFTGKLTNLINVNLQAVLLYNQDQDLKLQWSEALSLGVAYQFSNIPK